MGGSSTIRKRRVEEDSDDSIDNTPQYADKDTMAQRRIVRVKRSENSSAPSFQGAFKFAQNIGPGNAPSLATSFGTSETAGNNATDASSAAPTSGLFSFGSAANTADGTSAKLDTTFSFGMKQGENAKPTAPAFSFGSKPTDGAAPKFTFGASASKDGTTSPPLFKFGDAVNSFVAAKKQMEEQRSAEESDSACLTGDVDEAEDKDAQAESNNALASATSVVVASGDVLASIPSKLYIFKKETQTWAECGAGEAKVKRHEKPKDEPSLESSFVYRLIVRDGYSLNILLNGNFQLSKAVEGHAIFAAPDGKGVDTYLLKYTGHQVAERGKEFSKVLKETLQLALSDAKKDKKE